MQEHALDRLICNRQKRLFTPTSNIKFGPFNIRVWLIGSLFGKYFTTIITKKIKQVASQTAVAKEAALSH